jgi:uncharacterized protein with HEPN domain
MNSDQIYLRHMLDAARKAVAISRDYERADLDKDGLLGLALERLLEVIGEAANKVDESTRLANPQIPWRPITATRNRLIHAYFDIDYDIIWAIVTGDLPSLISHLTQLLNDQYS